MKPPSFEYYTPETLDDALDILAERGGEAKVLAGGQSLIPAMNFRLAQPTALVDLNGLTDLAYIKAEKKGTLRVGGMTRQRQLEHDPLVAKHTPLLHETMPFIAHPQIRNRGTLGGSLAHADPAAELPVVAVALGAQMKIQSKTGERAIPADTFFEGMFTTALAADEILVEVEWPAVPPRTGWSFIEFARRRGDYAMMGVAVTVTLDKGGKCEDARLVYLNSGDRPMVAAQAAEVLKGEKPSEHVIEAAAEKAAADEIEPYGNIHASQEYQRHLARVLTRRALATGFQRAGAAKA